jgi:hypothetical protein
MHDHTTVEKVRQLSLQQKPVKSLPPAESPGPSPSDFFPFGMLKERMSGTSYSSPDELISAISELIASFPKDQLISVSKNWMTRLNWVIKHRREHYRK